MSNMYPLPLQNQFEGSTLSRDIVELRDDYRGSVDEKDSENG